MSRRILTAILTVTVLAVVLFGIPLAIGLRRLYRNEAVVRLEREAARAGIEVPASFETTGDPVELPTRHDATLIALYDRRGRRLQGHGPLRADNSASLTRPSAQWTLKSTSSSVSGSSGCRQRPCVSRALTS